MVHILGMISVLLFYSIVIVVSYSILCSITCWSGPLDRRPARPKEPTRNASTSQFNSDFSSSHQLHSIEHVYRQSRWNWGNSGHGNAVNATETPNRDDGFNKRPYYSPAVNNKKKFAGLIGIKLNGIVLGQENAEPSVMAKRTIEHRLSMYSS